MDGANVRITLSLIGPGIMFVFCLTFIGTWLIERKRHYLLFLAGACATCASGVICQVLIWPADIGLNTMVSGVLYTSALILAVEGILQRSGKRLGWQASAAILAGFTALLWYFYYVDRSLITRIYIQNFGYGLVLLIAVLRLTALARGRYVDRILFWVLLVVALHFFPRTVLTVGLSAPAGASAFADSLFWQALQLALAVLGASLALAVLAATISDLIDDLRRERDTDLLTGILNRRGFETLVSVPARRPGERASLVLCDVDHFKRINDTHGHDTGDAVLHGVGALLRKAARKGDVVARLGGEEFAIFLPGTSLPEAVDCAERLRNAIAATVFAIPGGSTRVTASFGVTEIGPDDTWQAVYRRTDALLYRAKQDGRNRTVADGGGQGPLPDRRSASPQPRNDAACGEKGGDGGGDAAAGGTAPPPQHSGPPTIL